GLVARRLGGREELFRVHVEARGELGLARQLERLRNDRRRGDRPDEREPAADGDAREQKRENERPPDALPLLERLGLVGELEEDREGAVLRSEEHTSELQSRENLVCRLLLEKKKKKKQHIKTLTDTTDI